MMLPEELTNQLNNLKLFQLKNIIKQRDCKTIDYIRPIIETEFDINWTIKSTCYLKSKEPKLIGCTALHLTFMENFIDEFEILIKNGADYTVKNEEGFTVLHQVLEKFYKDKSMARLDSKFANLILQAHKDSKNYINPCNSHGLSHFHAACLCNDEELVSLFLKHGASVNDVVDKDSPIFPGYSPLHFAVRSYDLETVKILINSGADVHLKNAEGKTPMHMIIEQKIILLNSPEVDTKLPSDQIENVLAEHEKILNFLYQHNKNYSDHISTFHLVCTMKDSSTLESLLKADVDVNEAVSEDSPFWPGYTGLHFAALCNIDNLIFLLEREADIQIKNSAGETAFDLCLKKYKAKEIHKIMSTVKVWKDIMLSDNETTLLDLLDAMENSEKLTAFFESSSKRISAFVSTDSSLWPGYTALHISIILSTSNLEIVDTCLTAGADVAAQTANGSTALHLACRLEKWDHISALWQYYLNTPNLTDKENFSLLHIACAAVGGQSTFVKNLLRTKLDVNAVYKGKPISWFLKTGFTPLHVAVVVGQNYDIIHNLLDNGANRNAPDSNGFTPIHWLLATSDPDYMRIEVLSEDDFKDSVVSGLSYLHVASCIDDYEMTEEFVKQLLEKDEMNVNVAVNYDKETSPSFLAKIDGYTPLGLAVKNRNWRVAEQMVLAGDREFILTKQANDSTPFYDALKSSDDSHDIYMFIAVLYNSFDVQVRVEEDIGLTFLHIACYTGETDEIKRLLDYGIKLNAQIHEDSPVWPGWTPLHVLVRYRSKIQSDYIEGILHELKLEFDTMVQNTDGDTAIHIAYKYGRKDWLNFLLTKQNYNENPVNNEGLSHFHISCAANNLQAVHKLLKNGIVDVNRCVDPFLETSIAGQLPLHLALSADYNFNDDGASIEVVDLLIKNGAQVNTKDAFGETSLHKVVRLGKTKFHIFKKIVEAEADVNAIDIRGVTALDLLLLSANFSKEHLAIFIEKNCRFNAYNPFDEVGCMSRLFVNHGSHSEAKKILFHLMSQHPHTRNVDRKGRTVIHSLVANDFTSMPPDDFTNLISELLLISGCDIDDQDFKGRTALHMAAHHGNEKAIKGLLLAGADVNIIDNEGCSPSDYFGEKSSNQAIIAIAMQVKKLELLGLMTNSKIKTFAADVFQKHNLDEVGLKRAMKTELELAKSIQVVPPALNLFHILSEISSAVCYATKENKIRFDKFFKELNYEPFVNLRYLFKLQYRKALVRPKLIENASIALLNISGCPMECVEFIVILLTNDDLKSLIKADEDSCEDH